MEAAFLIHLVSYEEIVPFYTSAFGTSVMTMTMDFGRLELVRIQSSSDSIVISLMPFFWVMPQFGKKSRAAFFVLTGMFTVIVFSRIFLVQFACSAVVFVLFYWNKIPRREKYIGGGIIGILTLFCLKPVVEMLRFRFFSSFSVDSDSVRSVQIAKLMEGIKQKPWFGHGMGSYLPDYLRSETLPFSYETEYLSFVYQLGIVGFVVLIMGNICIFLKKILPYLRKNVRVVQVFSVLCLGWFFIRPLFNPSFLGLQNGFPVIGTCLLNVYYAEKGKRV